MLVANLGGPDAALRFQEKAGKKPLCCCPTDYRKLYGKVRTALLQFFVVRPFVELGFAIATYAGSEALALIFSAIALLQVIWGFGALFCFCKLLIDFDACADMCVLNTSDENLAEASEKIFGGYKFALIKVSVGLIVFQGIVEEILFATHAIEVSGNDHYTANEREQRYLGA
jgi:hypothetical protein